MLLSANKDYYFEQTTLNNKLHTEMFFKGFFILSRAIFFENSHSKVSRLLFILVCVSMGHDHFQNNEMCISWEHTRPTTVFFSYIKRQKTQLGKRGSKSVELLLSALLRKELRFKQSLPMRKCNTQPLFLVYVGCFFLMVCSRGLRERQTHSNMHAYMRPLFGKQF